MSERTTYVTVDVGDRRIELFAAVGVDPQEVTAEEALALADDLRQAAAWIVGAQMGES